MQEEEGEGGMQEEEGEGGMKEEGEKEEDGLVKGMEKEKKLKVGNFLGKYSPLGPRDDG